MYNIVVADDEQLERMVLRQSLEEYLGERCVIRMAANGREAVEATLLAEADIVIMDIEMPGMNGLEASRIITEKLPHCKIIMLTAYSEFDYAREAISFGSADYLLKPCADADLHLALDRVLAQIDQRRAGEEEKERSIERIDMLSSQIEEQIVRTVMGGHITPAYILEQMRIYGVDFQGGVFAILYDPHSSGDIATALKNIDWLPQVHTFLYCYDGKVYIINVSSSNDIDITSLTALQLKKLSQAAKTLWGHPLFAAIGNGFSNIQNAQLSCFQAQFALSKCTCQHPVITYQDDSETEASQFTDHPIINCVLFGDIEEIGSVASGFVNNLFAQQLEFDVLISRLNYYMAKTVQSLRLQTGISIPDIIITAPEAPEDIDGLKHTVTSQLCHLSDRLMSHEETKDPAHLKKVKHDIEAYVSRHYHEDIFLPGIARAMNYSTAYFSKLFKQCFQRNFITYLTDMRIDAAKELIGNTDMTIREIGEKVGYKDPNYFTKVFRKATGINPSEYRQSSGEQN